MTIHPDAQRILCFGDSNTWGHLHDAKGRLGVDARWTGLLQKSLGTDYEIIEEGLNSRTTDLEFSRKPGRNGKTYFRPCVESQSPLDLIIIMLGTNDLKVEYGPRAISAIGAALQEYIYIVRDAAKATHAPKIVLLSPIYIAVTDLYKNTYTSQSTHLSHTLGAELRKIVEMHNTDPNAPRCFFADAAEVATPGEDGIHMDAEGHSALAQYLAAKITQEWLV